MTTIQTENFFTFEDVSNVPQMLRRNGLNKVADMVDNPIPYVIPTDHFPKAITNPVLYRKQGYFIVPKHNLFCYLKIGKIVPKGDYLFYIEGKSFPVKTEGFVFIEKDLYFVPLEDLTRGIIRRSRKVKINPGSVTYEDFTNGNAFKPKYKSSQRGPRNPGVVSVPQIIPTPVIPVDSGPDENPAPSGVISRLAVSEVSNVVFDKQIRAIFHSTIEEEGSSWEDWEITDNP